MAYRLCLQGRGSEAVNRLALAALACLQARPPALWSAGQRRLFSAWPALGVSLGVRAEELQLTFGNSNFSALDASAYLRHALQCTMLDRQHPHWRAWRQRLGLAVAPPAAAGYRRLLSWYVSYYLREPLRRTHQLLTENERYVKGIESWRRKLRPAYQRSADCASMVWPARQAYLQMQAGDHRSRVIAAFHTGNYLAGLDCFGSATIPRRRRLLVLHEEPDFALRVQLLQDAHERGRLQLLSTRQLDPPAAVAFLRGGNANLTMFCDLPPAQGETVAVQLLGREARLTRGVATIALLASAPLLPLLCYRQQGRDYLETPGVVEARVAPGESLAQAVARITGQLSRLLESYLRRHPAQWYYLSQLPAYFASESGLEPLSV